MNRLLTTLIQLALLSVVIPLCYAMYQEIKNDLKEMRND